MLNQRLDRLDGLHGCIRRPALHLIDQCERLLQRKLLIVQGWRSVHEQLLIWQKGRTFNRELNEWEVTDAAAVVTKAKPGRSAHNVIDRAGARAALALDVIPLLDDGTPDWMVDDAFWEALYEVAWTVGLDPLGDPIGSYVAGDKGHFEEPGWTWKLEGLRLIQPTTPA